MENKTHWKTLRNPDFFGSYVPIEAGGDVVVKILSVAKETVTVADGKIEEHTIAQLENYPPWILNSINQKTITKALNTPFVEDWAGKRVTCYAAKVRAFGENVEAVRVRDKAPAEEVAEKVAEEVAEKVAEKPELTPSHDQWDGWNTAVVTGEVDIAEVKKHYTLTAKNEKLISKK
tara:strand:+ start:2501 stop:3028 length:528 start_codon:yes stop_codon:yes gene_type:complete